MKSPSYSLFAFLWYICFPYHATKYTLSTLEWNPPSKGNGSQRRSRVRRNRQIAKSAKSQNYPKLYLPCKADQLKSFVRLFPGGLRYFSLRWEGRFCQMSSQFSSIAGLVFRIPFFQKPLTVLIQKVPLMVCATPPIRLVRQNASSWNIDPSKVWYGFLAGDICFHAAARNHHIQLGPIWCVMHFCATYFPY